MAAAPRKADLSGTGARLSPVGHSTKSLRDNGEVEKLIVAHQAGQLQFFGNHARLANARAFAAFLAPLWKSDWVVYAKRPF
ncbi:MAG TPA: hypothetical protein VKP67_12035, partial [Xanthobacteraceae bacterium]|nr:hypothetical protein [Xanthobacteraceae bacterium]